MRGRNVGHLAAIVVAVLALQACAGRIRTPPAPAGGAEVFVATAYCTGRTTAAGTRVARGFVAADPGVLPIGTVIRVSGLPKPYNGVYTVMDTGADIRGRRLDIYLASCAEAVRFGRQPARVAVVHRHRG